MRTNCILTLLFLFLAACHQQKSSEQKQEKISQEITFEQKRIVYQVPEMEKVKIQKGITYLTTKGLELKFDIYSPPENKGKLKLPLVILVNGYPDTQIQHLWGMKQKDFQLFVSWGELVAASGMIAVTYETQYSHSESDSLIHFLCKNAYEYNIDKDRIALFGCSANALAVQSLLQEPDYRFKCAVMYYGIFQTPDPKYDTKIDSAASFYEFYWNDLHEIKSFSPEIPLFIAKQVMIKFGWFRKLPTIL